MIKPQNLVAGSKIAIISPSGAVNPVFVESAIEMLRKKGYDPIAYPSCFNKHFQLGGTDEERLADLQNALDDISIDAILCSRGGYGAIKLIDKIDFSGFIKKPKWFIGFSDITTFHIALNNLGVMSLHSQMTKDMHENPESDAVQNIYKILRGELPETTCESHEFNKTGIAEGELVGGNLSIIYSLQGTKFEINTDGKILFIEDLNEYLYHLDRMMISLKMAGKLKNLKGLIAGAFTDMKDNPNPFGKTPYEIISAHIAEYDFPVCYNFPVGHIDNNMPLICGGRYRLEVGESGVRLG
ncbi:MAG: LD-carboxypeptidase [Weeksellaceae bacterium]|nr:LD-carboxypeptidase [Weeksellaceae bacterium]